MLSSASISPPSETIMAPNRPIARKQKKRGDRIISFMSCALYVHLLPVMTKYLQTAGLTSNDPYYLLKILLKAKKKNPKGVLRGMSVSRVACAFEARNVCFHRDHLRILLKWKVYFTAWIKLAKAMGKRRTARKVYRVMGTLKASLHRQSVLDRVSPNAKRRLPRIKWLAKKPKTRLYSNLCIFFYFSSLYVRRARRMIADQLMEWNSNT